ncbi:MAG: carbohydrate kinase family protein [Cellulosilyticum sp.]|nr:carbohydrate kinase family protein [Cellulosilyticum sp.]
MKKILISGLVNTETTVKVKEFPIEYFPIEYPFFGVNTNVSGVAYNIAKALKTLGDEVEFITMTGCDYGASYVMQKINEIGVSTRYIKSILKETPNSVVLYDEGGKRQIYCDLKDVQEMTYEFEKEIYHDCDLIVACNTNFNRTLLKQAKLDGKMIATDVHVLADIEDSYNSDFMKYANILFLSDENIEGEHRQFLFELEQKYQNDIIVLGRGSKGALMYVKDEDKYYELPAIQVDDVINTVGAGDALFSGFIHFYTKGFSPIESLIRAEIFAAVKIGYDGAANGFIDEKQIEDIYSRVEKELH